MSNSGNSLYQTRSAVLFIIFNRPDTTARVFEEIRKARPAKLYVAADGPRNARPGEDALCTETRAIIKQADWNCEVITLFRDSNLGCKEAVSSAITWFFEQEEEGIILEDDCLPHNSFFRFCDELLERYRDDTRIRTISGCNFQRGNKRGDATYYFSHLNHIWGWASWRRVWKDYDKELAAWNTANVAEQLGNIFDEPLAIQSWLHIFKELKAGKIDTWDYQMTFIHFFNNGLSVIPNQNLISNIGFGSDATHTSDQNNPNANIPVTPLPETIAHPQYIVPFKAADNFTLENDFDIAERKRRGQKLSVRVKKLLRGK